MSERRRSLCMNQHGGTVKVSRELRIVDCHAERGERPHVFSPVNLESPTLNDPPSLEQRVQSAKTHVKRDSVPPDSTIDMIRAQSERTATLLSSDPSLFKEGSDLPRRDIGRASRQKFTKRDAAMSVAQGATRQHAGLILSYLRNDPFGRGSIGKRRVTPRASFDSTVPDSSSANQLGDSDYDNDQGLDSSPSSRHHTPK